MDALMSSQMLQAPVIMLVIFLSCAFLKDPLEGAVAMCATHRLYIGRRLVIGFHRCVTHERDLLAKDICLFAIKFSVMLNVSEG